MTVQPLDIDLHINLTVTDHKDVAVILEAWVAAQKVFKETLIEAGLESYTVEE